MLDCVSLQRATTRVRPYRKHFFIRIFMRFLDPKNDVAFKKIFGDSRHSNVLISFLNSVLDLPSPIKSIKIVNGDQLPEISILKETSLDLKAIDETDREFIIEMQVEKQLEFRNRALYYAAKAYAHQIKRSEEYKKLNPVIFLGILDFSLFEGENFLSQHYFINHETKNRDITDIELNFIELPKFVKTENECETLADKWVYFLKNADDLKVIPQSIQTEELKTAYETVEQFNWSEKELMLYESRSKFIASQMDALDTAHIEGVEKGLKKGLEQALSKMISNGISERDAKKILGMG